MKNPKYKSSNINFKKTAFGIAMCFIVTVAQACSDSDPATRPSPGTDDPEQPADKTAFYVSTTGNDNNAGSYTAPWRTIQKAVETVKPGSVVNIMGGTYYEEVNVTVSGTADNYIVIRNYQDQEVILNGNKKASELLTLNGVSYIKVKGLIFEECLGSYSVGVKISTDLVAASHHIEIDSNTFRHIYADASTTTYPPNVYAGAISVAGYLASQPVHNIIIKGNIIKDCRTGWTEAIGITGNVDGFLVTRNEVTNTGNIGINASGHWGISPDPATDYPRNGVISENEVSYCKSLIEGGAGIYLDGSSYMLVEKNISHHNVYGITIGCERENKSVSNNIIKNNLCYRNESFGIGMAGWSPKERNIYDCQIIHNTLFGNATQTVDYGDLCLISTTNAIVKNNIIYSTHSGTDVLHISDKCDNLTTAYNNYYSSAPDFSFSGIGGNLIKNDATSDYADPLFVNASLLDFTLQASSPCIDTGDPSYVPASDEKDLKNNSRKVGDAVDKGAYEKQ